MHWEADALWRSALALTAVAIVWAAIGFAAFAVYLLLVPLAGAAAAAAITAGVLLIVLGIGFAIDRMLQRPAARTEPVPLAKTGATNATAVALAQLAKDHPLLAIGCATLLGAADAMTSDNRRMRTD